MGTKINKTKFNKLIKHIESILKRQTLFTPTKDEVKILINSDEEQFWWLEYDGVYIKKANAGHYITAGICQHCKTQHYHLYTSYYGSRILPSCHKCWCNTDLD